jgi:hypothetical protein
MPKSTNGILSAPKPIHSAIASLITSILSKYAILKSSIGLSTKSESNDPYGIILI